LLITKKNQQKAVAVKSGTRKHSTMSSQGLRHIALGARHRTAELASRKYNHKFRTVNIPEVHHVSVQNFFSSFFLIACWDQ